MFVHTSVNAASTSACATNARCFRNELGQPASDSVVVEGIRHRDNQAAVRDTFGSYQ